MELRASRLVLGLAGHFLNEKKGLLPKEVFKQKSYPIGSMYGYIYLHKRRKFMVNVGKQKAIHGSYGCSCLTSSQLKKLGTKTAAAKLILFGAIFPQLDTTAGETFSNLPPAMKTASESHV